MAREDTQFSRDYQPKGRGKSKKTLIMEAMREQALMELSDTATNEETEKAWFQYLVKNAMDANSDNSGLCLRLITERGWSALKPSSECIQFEFDPSSTPTQQASQVIDAISDGLIPPDIGLALISGIKNAQEIEVSTELKQRIEALEELLNVSQP